MPTILIVYFIIRFVAGVVPRERVPGFERMLWRISRGNVFLRRAELEESLEDPATVKFIDILHLKSHKRKLFILLIHQLPCNLLNSKI